MGYTCEQSKIDDFTFNVSTDLSVAEKEDLIARFNKIKKELSLIEAYPFGNTSDEKRKSVDMIVMNELINHPHLMYMAIVDKTRNSSENIATYLLRANCDESIEYMLQDEIAPTVVDNLGRNLGMLCATEGKEHLVLIALDNYPASIQTTFYSGNNMGMIAASRGMVQATIKALDNPQASLQQNKEGDNIGMICARIMNGNEKMTPCFEYAAKNKKSLLQYNAQGGSMLTIAEDSGYSSRKLRELYGPLYTHAIEERDTFQIPDSLI